MAWSAAKTALHLTHVGKEVVLVEMLDMPASEGIFTERMHTIHFMDREPKLRYHTEMKCVEISDTGIRVRRPDGQQQFIEAESVVLATGMKSRAEERDAFCRCGL